MSTTATQDYKYIYFVGIGGIGMSALAKWLQKEGRQVLGYDREATPLTTQLAQEGIHIHFNDQVEAIPSVIINHPEATLIVYTPAIAPQNKILQHLRKHAYTLMKRAEVLTALTQQHFTIAVAGTHGKTTTSALLSHLLYTANKHVVGFTGGIAKGYSSNLIVNEVPGQKKIVVVEADEFDRSFLHINPQVAIVTAVDPDHLDIYQNEAAFQDAFTSFLARVPSQGYAIVQKDAAQKLGSSAQRNTICYALAEAPVSAQDIRIEEGCFYFDYHSDTIKIPDLQLSLPGYHNIENALAAITTCLQLDIAPQVIKEGLATFQGIERRFDYIIRSKQVTFIDDYAHHPVEITAFLKSVRALYPSKKITAIFRPHLYTRTRDFAEGFATSLDLADRIFLLDIYPAREESIPGITSACIFNKMRTHEKEVCTEDTLLAKLAQCGPQELVVLIGAGGVAHLIPTIKAFLDNQ